MRLGERNEMATYRFKQMWPGPVKRSREAVMPALEVYVYPYYNYVVNPDSGLLSYFLLYSSLALNSSCPPIKAPGSLLFLKMVIPRVLWKSLPGSLNNKSGTLVGIYQG